MMGHYDAQREAHEDEDRAAAKRSRSARARTTARCLMQAREALLTGLPSGAPEFSKKIAGDIDVAIALLMPQVEIE